MRTTSSSGTSIRSDQTIVPCGVVSNCALTRSVDPARNRVPVSTISTSASMASAFRSSCSAEYFAAAMLERTTSESSVERVVAIASARLNARKSMSASGRSSRNGMTTRRVRFFNCSLGVDGGAAFAISSFDHSTGRRSAPPASVLTAARSSTSSLAEA